MPIQVRSALTNGHDARDYDAMDGMGVQRNMAGDQCVTGLFPLDTPARN
jgi:hypothetical protein